ncbi:cell division protein YlmG/Ycf19 [Geomicrobium sp. JCM 19037]|uniref:YggT family protein n=1 Tax=Geomicrobium sp. JCM 19037 TaxID=1460634 RepID=UPI00045F376B|nr:YggT family protein [Geomicrobium sp. JCM 19037]GAK04628.1 cell division protein YlmG/Ycf19 [Geomicrobium sp. JCM 19037]
MALIGNIIVMALFVLQMAVFIYVLSSWLPGLRESQFGEALGKVVEPVMEPFRKIIPPIGMIDISPIVHYWHSN